MSEWQRRTAARLRDQLVQMGQREVPSNRDGFDAEFDALRALDQRVRSNHDEFYTAMLGSNMSKNRYRDVLPNEGTRVQLDPINDRQDGDYINANYVDGRRLFGVPFVYIATQAPLRSSIGDFWRMIFENNSVFIVMLCAEIENGNVKSERYWPDGVGGIMTVGPLTLTLVSENHRHDTIYRTIHMRTSDGRERDVFHMQYVRWPDQGIPQTSTPLMEIIHSLGQSSASIRTPIVVHCSGGVGRTGVFIALHVALALFQMEQPISIPKIVQYLKFCRSGMVQRKDQYLFLYYAVLREAEKMIWAIESSKNVGGAAAPSSRHLASTADHRTPSAGAAGAGRRGAAADAPSPSRRPMQFIPQHIVQAQTSAPKWVDPAEFGPSVTSGEYYPTNEHRGSSAASTPTSAFPPMYSSAAAAGAGGGSDIETALRTMQVRTQSYRQTPSVSRPSSLADGMRYAPAVGGGAPKPHTQTATASSVAARLPLERPADVVAASSSAALPSSTRLPSASRPSEEPVASPIQQVPTPAPRRAVIEVRSIEAASEPADGDAQRPADTARSSAAAQPYFFTSTLPSASEGAAPATSDLEAASRSFHANLFGGRSGVGKSDLSLL